ncbi:MAG: 30S ribosomal protein S16 [Kiritimatiellae bacterium]|nr:30S ribosomal protein S16 [Kiritimatiellia bacterium]
MVKIRLRRTGRTNAACWRIVAADSRSPRDGKFLEILGWYSPKQTGENFKLDLERVDYWVSVGAQMTEQAASLVRRARKGLTSTTDAKKDEKAARRARAKKAAKKEGAAA